MTGHNPDAGLSFFRQTTSASELVLRSFRTSVTGRCGKAEVSELILEVSQKLSGFSNCFDYVKGITGLDCRSWRDAAEAELEAALKAALARA
jgi:hypothetical protein